MFEMHFKLELLLIYSMLPHGVEMNIIKVIICFSAFWTSKSLFLHCQSESALVLDWTLSWDD